MNRKFDSAKGETAGHFPPVVFLGDDANTLHMLESFTKGCVIGIRPMPPGLPHGTLVTRGRLIKVIGNSQQRLKGTVGLFDEQTGTATIDSIILNEKKIVLETERQIDRPLTPGTLHLCCFQRISKLLEFNK